MMIKRLIAASALALLSAGCSDGSTAPDPAAEARRASARFDHLADSLAALGDGEGATVMRAMGEMVRLSGRVSTLRVSYDGAQSSYTAIGVQLDMPEMCEGDPGTCVAVAPTSSQTLLAWQGESMNKLLILFTDAIGTASFDLPDGEIPGDPLDEPVLPHAFGVLETHTATSESGAVAVAGSMTSAAPSLRGSCPASTMIPPTVSYSCAQADFRFAANATFADVPDDPEAPMGATHTLVMQTQPVAGISVEVTSVPGGPVRTQLERLRSMRARTGSVR